MSKIGKKKILIPKEVNVSINGGIIDMKGPYSSKKINLDTEFFEINITKKINYIYYRKKSLYLNLVKKMFLLCHNIFYSKIMTRIHITKCFGFRAHND